MLTLAASAHRLPAAAPPSYLKTELLRINSWDYRSTLIHSSNYWPSYSGGAASSAEKRTEPLDPSDMEAAEPRELAIYI